MLARDRVSSGSSGLGSTAYWGNKRDGTTGLTPYWANAARYESRNAALHVAYGYKEASMIGHFEVEQLPPRPPTTKGSGTGGRA